MYTVQIDKQVIVESNPGSKSGQIPPKGFAAGKVLKLRCINFFWFCGLNRVCKMIENITLCQADQGSKALSQSEKNYERFYTPAAYPKPFFSNFRLYIFLIKYLVETWHN